MASPYTGSATATQAPGPAPSLDISAPPIANLPVDADAFNSASTYQPWKQGADWDTFLAQRVRRIIGVSTGGVDLQFRDCWNIPWSKNTSQGQPYTGSPWSVRSSQFGTGAAQSNGHTLDATHPMPYLAIVAGNANSDDLSVMSGSDDSDGQVFTPAGTNTVIVAEWIAALSTFVTNNTTYAMGFAPGNGSTPSALWLGATPNGLFFRKLSGETKWKAVTGGGAGAQASGAVGPAAADDEWHRYRIEFHGSAAPGFSVATALYYIDDTLVATHPSPSNFPTSSMRFGWGSFRTAGGATNQINVGGASICSTMITL
jgi:hypothetical protein